MYERIERPDDPNRCQHVGAKGQCNLKKMEGSQFCRPHGGPIHEYAQKQKELQNYQIGKYQAILEQKRNSPELKTLNDEVAILRVTLEQRLKMCQTDVDLLTHSQAIADLVSRIERTVVACAKLEDKLGMTFDRARLIEFAQEIVSVLTDELTPEQLQSVGDKILATVREYTG